MSPHNGIDDLVFPADSFRLAAAFTSWLFCTERDGCKNVHDKVGPEHLNDVKWNLSDGAAADDSDNANNDVNGNLELQEFLHVIKDSSSPFNRSIN